MENYTLSLEQQNKKINRSKRYSRQKVSAMIARTTTNHSVQNCMISSGGNQISVKYNPQENHACYSGLFTCGSIWDCPVCSAKISSRRRDELKIAMDKWITTGGSVVMVTFTLRHNLGDSLKSVADSLTNAIRYVHSGAPYKRITDKYGIVGTVSATEVRFNPRNGWHYHKHQILFLKSSEVNTKYLENWIYNRYFTKLEQLGFDALPSIGVKVSEVYDQVIPDYIAKWGLEDEMLAESKESESYHPFELLEHENLHDRFVEYSQTMMGRRQLTWSRGLRDLLDIAEELSDLEIASADMAEEYEVLITIEPEEWRYVVKHELRAELLNRAEQYPDRLSDWFRDNVTLRVLFST